MVYVLSCKPLELPEYLADRLVVFGKWMSKDEVQSKLRYWAIPLKALYYVMDDEISQIVAVGRTAQEAEASAKAYFEWKKLKKQALNEVHNRLKNILNEFLSDCRKRYRILSDEELASVIEPVLDEFRSRVLYRL
ncbi:MAG: hypothetical protein QXZ68_04720 [Candidatus Bathyarchaeia archaeon]